MTTPFAPHLYTVLAITRDGPVVLGSFETVQERDRFYAQEYAAFRDGGMDPDIKDVCRGEVHGMTGANGAEEADQMYQAFTQGALL